MGSTDQNCLLLPRAEHTWVLYGGKMIQKRNVQWHPVPLRNHQLWPILPLTPLPIHSWYWTKLFSPIILAVKFPQPFCVIVNTTLSRETCTECVQQRAQADASSREMQPHLGRKLLQQNGQKSVMTQGGMTLRATADRSGFEGIWSQTNCLS